MSDQPVDHRRTFLTGGLVGAAAGLVGAASAGVMGRDPGAQATTRGGRPRVEWRLASSFPKSLDRYTSTCTMPSPSTRSTGGRPVVLSRNRASAFHVSAA